MSQRKSTAKKPAAHKSAKTRPELRRELARNIAAIFANPETPVVLHNYLGRAMCEIHNSTPGDALDNSEEYNFIILEEYAKAQKGGA